jgi:RimJ/RimL family protein N-acetyltransferase
VRFIFVAMSLVEPWWAEALSKTLTRVRSRGVREVAALAQGRIRESVWSDDRLIMLVREAGGPDPHVLDLSLREATAADAVRYALAIGTDSVATFRARLNARAHCWLVESGGRVVHATWMTLEGAWTRELRSCVRPPQGDAYVYESFTREDARGRGIYPFALAGICARAALRDVRRVWVGVEIHNLPSLRAVTKAGFREALEIPYRRRLGRVTVGAAQGPDAHSPARLHLAPRCN